MQLRVVFVKQKEQIMAAVYMSPFYAGFLIFFYILYVRWVRKSFHAFYKKAILIPAGILYFFAGAAMAIGFFLPSGSTQNFFNMIGYCWLGIFMYLVGFTLIAIILSTIIGIIHNKTLRGFTRTASYKYMMLAALVATTVISVYGLVHSKQIVTKEYNIHIDQDGGQLDDLKIILISDLHLGYNVGEKHIAKVVDAINAQNADVVLIAGDIFNNEYASITNPDKVAEELASIETTYGVYAAWGNHDVEEKILAGFNFPADTAKEPCQEMLDFIDKAGITVLEDEYVVLEDSVYIFGRLDGEITEENKNTRLLPEEICAIAETDKPLIVIDHEPDHLEELADAGVDLDLCGHTHDGQVFPANIVMDFIWENPYGYAVFGNMQNIVSSGCGIWGPAMRVGTDCEVCVINCTFNS